MREPPDTCEVSEVFDFWEHSSSVPLIRPILERAVIGDLSLSIMMWCDHWLVHFRSGTLGSIGAQPGAHSTINTIHTPIQRNVAGKSALIVSTTERRDLPANAYFSCMI